MSGMTEMIGMVTKAGRQTSGECSLRIKGVYNSLGKTERNIADFVFQHSREMVNLTIEELAQSTGSSIATVIRFCKKLGLEGFKDLKNIVVQELLEYNGEDSTEGLYQVNPNDNIKAVKEKVFHGANRILDETLSILDDAELQRAVDSISQATLLQIIGVGNSGIVAQYAYSKFFRIGIATSMSLDPYFLKMQSALLDETKVLLAVSSSGHTKTTVEAGKLAKEAGAKVISLSDFAITPLTKISDIKLFTTPRNFKMFENEQIPLIIAQINVIDILYLGVLKKVKDLRLANLQKTIQATKEEKY